MPRQVRVEYEGAIYHVLNRGDRGENISTTMWIVRISSKRWRSLSKNRFFQVHAYCLMRNHFHLAIETPEANLVVQIHPGFQEI